MKVKKYGISIVFILILCGSLYAAREEFFPALKVTNLTSTTATISTINSTVANANNINATNVITTTSSTTNGVIANLLASSYSKLKNIYYVSDSTSITSHSDNTQTGSIAWCVSQLSGSSGTIVLPPRTAAYTTNSNYTIPNNVVLVVPYGATITPAIGTTLTIGNTSGFASHKIFNTGSGSIIFARYIASDPAWFGAIPNDSIDDSVAINAAITAVPKFGTVQIGSGVFDIGSKIHIYEKPITLKGTGQYATILKKMDTLTDAVIVVEGCDRARVGEGFTYYDAWWSDTFAVDLGGASIQDMILEGGDRNTVGSGIIFRGKNSDILVQNIHIYNFMGSGIKASDPYGSTGLDLVHPGAVLQECVFNHIEIKNCGYGTGTYRTSHAALEIGRNVYGTSNHNNLRFNTMKIIYPRWIGVRILNKNVSGNIHEVRFNDLFIHGNTSLSGADKDGISWASDEDLCVIGNRLALSETENIGDIKVVYFNNAHILEMENTHSGVYVGNANSAYGVGISMIGSKLEAGANTYGITFDGAASSYVGDIASPLRSPMQNLINLIGMRDNTDLLTLGPVATKVANNTSVGCGALCVKWINIGPMANIENIVDTTLERFIVSKTATDTAATDVWGGSSGITIGYTDFGRYWRRAYYIPAEALDPATASDTNYATIYIRMYGATGALFDTGTTTTKTSGSGGTGDWTAHLKVDLNIPSTIENLANSGSIGIQITKTGTGVKIPPGTFVVETSRWRYY